MRDIQFYTICFLRILKIYHNARLLANTKFRMGTKIVITIKKAQRPIV